MSIKSILKSVIFDKEFEERIDFLSKVPIFAGIGKKGLGKINTIMHFKTYLPDEIIFTEGKLGKALFIIKTGEVVISKKMGNAPESTDREKVMTKFHDGDFFGEMALLEELPRSATARTSKRSDIFLIYKVRFDWLLEVYPAIGTKILHNLAKVLSSRLRDTNELV